MNKQTFYYEIKNSWKKLFPYLSLPVGYCVCEIDKYFYVFENEDEMQYSIEVQDLKGNRISSSALLIVAGEPYNDNSRLLVLIATKAIRNWRNNPNLKKIAFISVFGNLINGVDSLEYFNEYMPNRYGLILNEIITK